MREETVEIDREGISGIFSHSHISPVYRLLSYESWKLEGDMARSGTRCQGFYHLLLFPSPSGTDRRESSEKDYMSTASLSFIFLASLPANCPKRRKEMKKEREKEGNHIISLSFSIPQWLIPALTYRRERERAGD